MVGLLFLMELNIYMTMKESLTILSLLETTLAKWCSVLSFSAVDKSYNNKFLLSPSLIGFLPSAILRA